METNLPATGSVKKLVMLAEDGIETLDCGVHCGVRDLRFAGPTESGRMSGVPLTEDRRDSDRINPRNVISSKETLLEPVNPLT